MKVAILIVTIWRNEFEARHFQLHKLDERRERMEDEHWARDEQEDEMRLRMVAREGRHWRQRSAEERARQEEQAKMIRRMIAIEERSLVLRREREIRRLRLQLQEHAIQLGVHAIEPDYDDSLLERDPTPEPERNYPVSAHEYAWRQLQNAWE